MGHFNFKFHFYPTSQAFPPNILTQPGPRSAFNYSHRAASTPAAPQPCCSRLHQCPQSSPLMQTSIRCYFLYAGRSIRRLISLGRIEDKAYPARQYHPSPSRVHTGFFMSSCFSTSRGSNTIPPPSKGNPLLQLLYHWSQGCPMI